MDNVINQFRRIYSDNGSGDVDFTDQETQLREAQARVIIATTALVRASERLNKAALDVGIDEETVN